MVATRVVLALGVALLVLAPVAFAPAAFADEDPAPPAGVAAPGIDAPGIDLPPSPIDAPGLDAPGLDAPGLDAPPSPIVVDDVSNEAPPMMTVRPCPVPCEAPTIRRFDTSVNRVTSRMPACPSRPCGIRSCERRFRRCDPSPAYGGLVLQAYPGVGFGLEVGMWFCRTKMANLAWEVNLNYQDLTDGFNNIATGQSGKWVGARVGVKASFCPKGNSHPTLRAGLAWNIATGDVANGYDLGDIPDTPFAINYFGGYLGVGWEWDLFNGRITTGPEIFATAAPLADRTEGDDGAYTATVAWHVILNF